MQFGACPTSSVLVQNVRDFPQSKLDSEIIAPFLLNKHGDLNFLIHKTMILYILFTLIFQKCKKKMSEGKKDISESVRKTVTPTCKL